MYTLKSILDSNNTDYFQGILEFMEYWSLYTHSNSPMIFPNETISKSKYFTQSTYHYIIDLNKIWHKQEFLNIINIENGIMQEDN